MADKEKEKTADRIDQIMALIEAGDEKTIKGLERFLDIMLNLEEYEEES